MKTAMKLVLTFLLALAGSQSALAEVSAAAPSTQSTGNTQTAPAAKSDREKELERQLLELKQAQLEKELAEIKASQKQTETSQSRMSGIFIGCGLALVLLLVIGLALG